jgi:rubrerythrin
MNILECTIKMKQETRTHYERLAETVTDVELKRLFSLLAAAEVEHIDKLTALQGTMKRLNSKDFSRLEESVCVYSPHIDPRHLADALRHDPDAYRHVVQEEEETIEFFDQLSDQADNEQLKRICRLQAAREREHLTMLENIFFFVEEPRTYLEWGEFSNLKSL